MKICILIPAFNEAAAIGRLIQQIKDLGLPAVVVDDGSSDGTGKVAAASGATVITHPKNEGKGTSLKKGFDYLLKADYEAVITMDGDGQHDPSSISDFIKFALSSEAGIIVGNRMAHTQNMPLARKSTNKFLSWLTSLIAGQSIPDTQCGFRLIKMEVLRELELVSDKYEIESEILIKASKLGYKIGSVPIKTIYSSQVSKINPIVEIGYFVKMFIRNLF